MVATAWYSLAAVPQNAAEAHGDHSAGPPLPLEHRSRNRVLLGQINAHILPRSELLRRAENEGGTCGMDR
jgi:hypothetical protein